MIFSIIFKLQEYADFDSKSAYRSSFIEYMLPLTNISMDWYDGKTVMRE